MVDERQGKNLNREEIGKRSGMGGAGMSGSGMERESGGQKMKQGWNEFRSKVRQKWNQVSDRDLDSYQTRGKNDLVGFLQQRTGSDRSTIERDVDNIARETNYRW